MSNLTDKTADKTPTKTFEEIDAESRRIQARLDKRAKGSGNLLNYEISDRAIYYFTNGSRRRGYSAGID